MKNAFIIAGILLTTLLTQAAPIVVGARSKPQVIVPGVNYPAGAPIVVSASIPSRDILHSSTSNGSRHSSSSRYESSDRYDRSDRYARGDRYDNGDRYERSDRNRENRRREREDQYQADREYSSDREYSRNRRGQGRSGRSNYSSGRVCKLDSSRANSNRVELYPRQEINGYGDSDMIVDGSVVEVIGYTTIYYKHKGDPSEGVAFRLLENNTSVCPLGICSIRGEVGHVYYTYARNFKCY